jgi:hypothetical protein
MGIVIAYIHKVTIALEQPGIENEEVLMHFTFEN